MKCHYACLQMSMWCLPETTYSIQNCIACDSCDTWYHAKCTKMPLEVFHELHNVSLLCRSCGLLIISTSLFKTKNKPSELKVFIKMLRIVCINSVSTQNFHSMPGDDDDMSRTSHIHNAIHRRASVHRTAPSALPNVHHHLMHSTPNL